MRNVGTSTINEPMRLGRTVRRSLPTDDRFRYENIEKNRFSEIPLKNSVQNVQNQIIQENMMLRNQLGHENIGYHQPTDYPINIHNIGPRPAFLPQNLPQNIIYHPNRITTNMARMQSQLQQYSLGRNGAMPQEPRKLGNLGGISPTNVNYRPFPRPYSEAYPPDIAPNLNDAFCQGTKNTKAHNLNETYDQQMFDNDIPGAIDATTVTNNATFNDDTISIEFINDSPSPTENGGMGIKSNSYDNRTAIPDVPIRKKKAQKLEQLMLSAITSQTEVVSKILAAQDSMVTRILDLDQDRQNRLENRLDQLMNVVQATVLNKSSDSKESEGSVPQQPLAVPLCFSPPPKPGAIPPKLDLVPPKPCRVPCTSPSANIELINQNQIQTRPGVIGSNRPGTIWTKLGPVSQSPFVKAQQQITAVTRAAEHWRTKSSAERRIARAFDTMADPITLIQESQKLIETEKLMEERIENARRLSSPERDATARRKLFEVKATANEGNRENKQASAAIVMTKAFLDIERQSEEKSRYSSYRFETDTSDSDELLTGQGESYDRLRRLSVRVKPNKQAEQFNNIRGHQLDSSTPAKPSREGNNGKIEINHNEPRQTIQQLAELVMNSTRWRNAAADAGIHRQSANNLHPYNGNELIPTRPARESDAQRQSNNKARDWLQDRYSYGIDKQGNYNDDLNTGKNHPIGFTAANLNIRDEQIQMQADNKPIGFTTDFLPNYGRPQDTGKNNERQQDRGRLQRNLIDRYTQDGKNCRRRSGHGADDEEDEEFLDTTTTLQPRKPSLTSTGGSTGSKSGSQCVIS